MAYEPTNWQSGDVISSARLNKIEQGIANAGGGAAAGGLVLDMEFEDELPAITSMTAGEIFEAANSGVPIFLRQTDGTHAIIMTISGMANIDGFALYIQTPDGLTRFGAETEDDYFIALIEEGDGGEDVTSIGDDSLIRKEQIDIEDKLDAPSENTDEIDDTSGEQI